MGRTYTKPTLTQVPVEQVIRDNLDLFVLGHINEDSFVVRIMGIIEGAERTEWVMLTEFAARPDTRSYKHYYRSFLKWRNKGSKEPLFRQLNEKGKIEINALRF